jgi:hypothetical protein
MYENINEQIAVLVIFGLDRKKVQPCKIKWKGREYLITHVDYQYKYKEGRSVVHVFSVTDGVQYFELKFDSENMKWMLGRVSDNVAG